MKPRLIFYAAFFLTALFSNPLMAYGQERAKPTREIVLQPGNNVISLGSLKFTIACPYRMDYRIYYFSDGFCLGMLTFSGVNSGKPGSIYLSYGPNAYFLPHEIREHLAQPWELGNNLSGTYMEGDNIKCYRHICVNGKNAHEKGYYDVDETLRPIYDEVLLSIHPVKE